MATKKPEVISLRKWILKGKDFDHIVVCSKCRETKKITQFQDLFVCLYCGLDLRAFPTKAGMFTVWKENLIPVFLWSEPIKTIRKKQKKKVIVKKRKSFDE